MPNDVGKRIKECRENLRFTYTELGQKVGVGASTVRKWELGDIKNMRADNVKKLADALEVSPAYLMGWEETQSVKVKEVRTNNGLIGQANAPVNINGASVPVLPLSKEEAELLRIYGALSVRGRIKLLTGAMELEAEETNK